MSSGENASSNKTSSASRRPAGAGHGLFPPEVVVAVKALACELPSRLVVPLSRLHVPYIDPEVVSRGIVAEILGTTMWRRLSEDAIKALPARVVDLPTRSRFRCQSRRRARPVRASGKAKASKRTTMCFSGREDLCPGPGTSPPERCSPHPGRPPGRARVRACGALQYMAAWDVHRAKIFGHCEPKTGIEPFGRLAAQVIGFRALLLGAASVPGCRQRLQPSRPTRLRAAQLARGPTPDPSPVACPRLLAQPSGDLQLGDPAQSPNSQRLFRPR